MAEKVYKLIELTGTSAASIEKAIEIAVAQAAKTVRNMSWFEVLEIRGAIKDNKVAEFQVKIKVGFKVED